MLKKKKLRYQYKKIKNHFYFGISKYKIGCLFLKKKFTNQMITLTDLNYKVIVSQSGGASISTNNKRRKTISQTLENIFYYLNIYFEQYQIFSVKLMVQKRIKNILFTIIKIIKKYKIQIKEIIFIKREAHNGIRGKKIKRR